MVYKLNLKLDSISIGRKISDIYILYKLINKHCVLFQSIFKHIFFTVQHSLFFYFSLIARITVMIRFFSTDFLLEEMYP